MKIYLQWIAGILIFVLLVSVITVCNIAFSSQTTVPPSYESEGKHTSPQNFQGSEYPYANNTPKQGIVTEDGRFRVYLDEAYPGGYTLTEYLGKEEHIVVPPSYDGTSIIKIGYGAFAHTNTCKTVTLPNTVKVIDNLAFAVSACGCMNVHGCSLEELIIKEGSQLETVGYQAFYNCTRLKRVILPDSVKNMGSWTFGSCDSLKEVRLPSGLTKIPENIFEGCKSLVKVEIPSGVTEIEEFAFYGCSSLKKIEIPNGVTTIGGWVFASCSSLEAIRLPAAAVNVEDDFLLWCGGLQRIEVDGKNPVFAASGNCLIEKETKRLIKGANTVTIPNDGSVTVIGDKAFNQNAGLKSIHIPSPITTIESRAFLGCTGLESITVDEGNTEYSAAGNCLIDTETKTIFLAANTAVIPNDGSVEVIGSDAFRSWSGGDEITIPSSVKSIENSAFNFAPGLKRITIPESVTTMGGRVFYGCNALEEVVILAPLEGISYSMFENCKSLTRVVLPDTVKSIASRVFADCTSLKSISLPNGIKSLGENAFEGCVLLEEITVPEGTEKLPREVFYGCKVLHTVRLPSTLCDIDDFAFRDCKNIRNLTVDPNNPTYHSVDNCVIETESKTLVLGVAESVIPTDGSVTKIGNYAFDGRYTKASLTLPEGIGYIGRYAFGSSKELEKLDLPESLITIDDGAFSSCTKLKNVELPYATVRINSRAFSYSGLESITMLGILCIGEGAFWGCEDLKSVTIGKKLLTVESYAFYDCKSLAKIFFHGESWAKVTCKGQWNDNTGEYVIYYVE